MAVTSFSAWTVGYVIWSIPTINSATVTPLARESSIEHGDHAPVPAGRGRVRALPARGGAAR